MSTYPFAVAPRSSAKESSWPWGGTVVGIALIFLAIGGAQHAGSWNDGSRLATVEALVDHHTFAIDRSIFVRPSATANPYPSENALLSQRGTLDKIFVNGRFYSDKSPVPAVIMAGAYWTLQKSIGLRAADHPERFCLVMVWLTSGLAHLLAVWFIYRLCVELKLPTPQRVVLTLSFAFGTTALT